MNRRRGRPKKSNSLDEYLEIRVGTAAEKQAFKDAADLAGIAMASWARERLRQVAIRELERASVPVAFLEEKAVKKTRAS